ncbi:AAA family ATPase [Lacibacter sediminis]|jgi:MoxR-like ATPase|uniref:MoxR family ATPase n=1 Tax=Lacibacter sediminis TaxID=2760713 RepID=A0A7G5XB79_9BACT|nr:MoxR family ATPase [Lacibacter sediminis]QNA42732.1 MoxR family ATPase [Lacibacter sediminis]
MENQFFEQRTDLSQLNNAIATIREAVGKVIVGQEQMLELMIAGILADGHILIEGVPGVAKTLSAKLMAKLIDADFSRIQFTPDLMPSDVLGTSVFNPKEASFQFKQGPLFSNIVLIDEINRAPAKTQSALFEVMEERQVTVDGTTYQMSVPFMVLATQNPVDQEGTYRLPEAQLDRFLFKIEVGYPSLEEEVIILSNQHQADNRFLLNEVTKILSASDIAQYRETIRSIVVEQKLLEFIARIVHETRNNPSLFLGASPRASLAIVKASKAFAAMRGRDFITPEDIIEVTPHVLRHRIILTPEKEMEGITADELVDRIIKSLEVPR